GVEHALLDRAAADRADATTVGVEQEPSARDLRRGAGGVDHRRERAAAAALQQGEQGLGHLAHEACSRALRAARGAAGFEGIAASCPRAARNGRRAPGSRPRPCIAAAPGVYSMNTWRTLTRERFTRRIRSRWSRRAVRREPSR